MDTLRTITTYETLEQMIATSIVADSPLFIWGAPGIGKTHVIERVARNIGYSFHRLSAATRPPEEFGGYPRATGSSIELLLPEWAHTVGDTPTAVLLDDLVDAHSYTQAAAYSLADQRAIGSHKLPLRIIAAGNPPQDNVFGSLPPKGIRARFLNILFRPTIESWAKQIKEFERDSRTAQILQVIAAYLEVSGTLLVKESEIGIACPRTWHAAARAIAAGADVRLALGSVIPEADQIVSFVGEQFDIISDKPPTQESIITFAGRIRNIAWLQPQPQWWQDAPVTESAIWPAL